MSAPAILELALNGATPKSRNPHVPTLPHELVADALACLEAGASIVHTHSDNPGAPPEAAAARYLEHFLPVLAARPDALLYPTVGFAPRVEESLGHFELLAAGCRQRIGVVDPGSVNLGRFAYVNTPAAIAHALALCARLGLGPSIAIYEPGFLRAVLRYQREGRLPRGTLVKLYLGGEAGGLDFGLPPTPRMLDVYLELLGDCPLPWSVAAFGGDVFEHGLARHALERGGHLHLGLEDYAGPKQPTNLELLHDALALCRAVGRPPASPTETAGLLHLP